MHLLTENSAGHLQRVQIFLKPFIGEMFTYKKHSIHRNSSAMVVTDIKQTCPLQGLGVTFTSRKCQSKLIFTMKDFGHMLPGGQNWTFASYSRCYYLKKSHANHSIKQLSKFAKLVCLYKLIYKRAFVQVAVWVVRHKINPDDAWHTGATNAELRMHTCAGSSESLSHVVSTKISWNYVRRQFNFNRAGSDALHACVDPEHFVRGGRKRGPKCQ